MRPPRRVRRRASARRGDTRSGDRRWPRWRGSLRRGRRVRRARDRKFRRARRGVRDRLRRARLSPGVTAAAPARQTPPKSTSARRRTARSDRAASTPAPARLRARAPCSRTCAAPGPTAARTQRQLPRRRYQRRSERRRSESATSRRHEDSRSRARDVFPSRLQTCPGRTRGRLSKDNGGVAQAARQSSCAARGAGGVKAC